MHVKDKHIDQQTVRKSSFVISVIVHVVLLILFNFAAMYLFTPAEKRINYIQLESRNIPPETPPEKEPAPAPEEKAKPLPFSPPPVELPQVTTEDETLPAITDSLPKSKQEGVTKGKGKNSDGIPDSIKSLAELKILVAEDIKRNYGKTDQDRIRKMWRRYIEQNPYGITYDGYLGDKPGMYLPIDDILKILTGGSDEPADVDAEGLR